MTAINEHNAATKETARLLLDEFDKWVRQGSAAAAALLRDLPARRRGLAGDPTTLPATPPQDFPDPNPIPKGCSQLG